VVAIIGFLALPKSMSSLLMLALHLASHFKPADKQFEGSLEFHQFRWQLFHSSLAHIFLSLKPYMTTTKVTLCGDGHFRCVIYGLGPYIADYPEQTLLALVVFGWCPK
jgi:hypothetical protein